MVLAGCGKQAENTGAGGITESIPQTEQEPADETGTSDGTGKTDETGAETYLLIANGGDLVYEIDAAGNRLACYDLAAMRKAIGDDSYYCSSYSLVGVLDGFLIFQEYGLIPGGEGNYGDLIYGVDTQTLKMQPIWLPAQPEGYAVECCSIYDGNLYATVNENGIRSELCFVLENGTFQAQKTVVSNKVSRMIDDQTRTYDDKGSDNRGCYLRMLRENGFFLLYDYDDEQCYRVLEDGSRQALTGMPKENVNGIHYDAEGFVYLYFAYNDETATPGIYYYDFEEMTTKLLLEYDPYYTTDMELFYDEGCVYMCTDTGTEYGMKEILVYTLDVKTGERTDLFTVPSKPGASHSAVSADSVSNLKKWGEDLYMPAVVGKELMWTRLEVKDQSADYVDLGCPLETITTFVYGTVDYYSAKTPCPICGQDLQRYYGEYFRLDGSYSPFADAINARLKQIATNAYEAVPKSYTREEVAEDEEGHQEYAESYCETNENYVNDVEILHDRYLAVNGSSYWYGGGAHGMPGVEQYVFDLTTGEEISFRDLYSGSEEDFKTLCAEKTREDMLSRGDMSPYFETDPDTLYQEAYDDVSFEYTQILLREDGAYLNYAPYEMGPYADGFIEVRILDESIFR